MVGHGPNTDWRSSLYHQVEAMGPWPRGRFVPDPDTAEHISGELFLDPGYLRTAIDRALPANLPPDHPEENPNDQDPRIAASRMTRQYCATLTCVAMAGLANGVGIDLSPARCHVIYHNNVPFRLALDPDTPLLLCAQRPTSWPVSGPTVATLEQLREWVWTRLYAHNLAPLFTSAVSMINVPERLLWTNAAEWIAMVMESAGDSLPPAQVEPILTEGRALLDAESLPGLAVKSNPLKDLLEWIPVDGESRPIQTRHLCCLAYLQSDRYGLLCQNCPLLPLPDRAALVRERREAGKTKSDGPAQRRSIETGVTRVRPDARKVP